MRRKVRYRDHLQWMLSQRRELEKILQLAGHEKHVVDQSDKCGDHCLVLPNCGPRVSSANVGLFKYRISLQANVYAGKLYHLSLLLPNLTTGANFGITSALTGLARMIQLGEVTPTTRTYWRGFDGGSENDNKWGLAFNSTLVGPTVRRFDVVQQHRLPPDHSHHYLTDGTFSVIEEWLTGAGFAGCATLGDLLAYLLKKFERATNFKNKRVEIKILVANFAFKKWFEGHLNHSHLSRIGDPLVWRHTWVAEESRVRVQYKYSLTDHDTFQRSEWGPWVEEEQAITDENGHATTPTKSPIYHTMCTNSTYHHHTCHMLSRAEPHSSCTHGDSLFATIHS